MNFLDLSIHQYFVNTRAPGLTDFFHFFTNIFDIDIYFFILVLITCVYINYYKNLRTSLLFLTSLFFTGTLVLVLKMYFATSRPENAVIHVLGNSFPSYHAAISVTFFFSIYYIFREKLLASKVLFFWLCLIFVSIVSFSRIYLGVHWFSDILGGLIVGGFMVWYLKHYLAIK